MTQLVSLADFWLQLRRHDWTYCYSDDPMWYRAGKTEQDRLERIADQSPEHKALFNAMEEHGWHRGPLPEQPVAGPSTAQSLVACIGMFALIMLPLWAWAYQ